MSGIAPRTWSSTTARRSCSPSTERSPCSPSFRFRRLRPLLAGEPIVIVQDGRLLESNLRRERLTVEEVAEEARMQKIASLEDVQWAMLETTGKISFIPKQS